MISIVKRITPVYCPNCGNDTVALYDDRDRRINYAILFKYNNKEQIKKKLENANLKYMRCDSCKSIYILDWTRDELPYPATKIKYKKFEE